MSLPAKSPTRANTSADNRSLATRHPSRSERAFRRLPPPPPPRVQAELGGEITEWFTSKSWATKRGVSLFASSLSMTMWLEASGKQAVNRINTRLENQIRNRRFQT